MKLFLNILFILLAVATVTICAVKPDMHKTVMVYDSAYVVTPQKEVETEKQVIPIMEKPAEVQPVKVEVQTVTEPVKQVKSTSSVAKTVTKTTPKPVSQTQKTVVKTVTKPAVKTETKPAVKTETKPVVKVTEVPAIVETVPVQVPTSKVLTQQEETIAWNKWRSNLQNQIMQDVKLPTLPNGIVFKFSFTVDKYGKVSNLQTWSTTAAYTPYAIQYIAPLIRSYQGRSILKFPEGSTRVTTEVTGGWKISDNTRYSTPQDYHDIEKVLK